MGIDWTIADTIHETIPSWSKTVYDGKQYIPNPKPRPDLTPFYEQGLLRKEQLVHGKYYRGACRNAVVARWHEGLQKFFYVRHKFGDAYEEEIEHPADDEGTDIFICMEETIPKPDEEVKGEF